MMNPESVATGKHPVFYLAEIASNVRVLIRFYAGCPTWSYYKTYSYR